MRHLLKKKNARKPNSSALEIPPVDIHSIPYTLHLGFNVPKILADLRDQIDFTNGLKLEGIFRISGCESEIVGLYDEYTRGCSISKWNSHNAASLMKRWFKSWAGSKLLGEIEPSEFQKNPYLDVEQYLTEPKLSIWRWLLQLLCDIYAHREYNMMSATNIAIVWTPALVGTEEMSDDKHALSESLIVTQCGTALLSHLIENNGELNPTIKRVKVIRKKTSDGGTHNRSRSVPDAEKSDVVQAQLHPAFSPQKGPEREFVSFNSPPPSYSKEQQKPAAKRRTRNHFRFTSNRSSDEHASGHSRNASVSSKPPPMLSEISFGNSPALFHSQETITGLPKPTTLLSPRKSVSSPPAKTTLVPPPSLSTPSK